MNYKIRMLGISDDITTCEACGKANLKRTVVLEFGGDDIRYYGCDCAGAALYGKKSTQNTAIVMKQVTWLQAVEKVRAATGSVAAICEAQGFRFDNEQNAFVRADGLKVVA